MASFLGVCPARAFALEQKPLDISVSERYNKALSFYKAGKTGLAKAYWRQVLFQKPANKQVRSALKAVGDKKYFWLWIAEDFVLALIAIAVFVLCFSMWRFQGVATQKDYSSKNMAILFIKQKIGTLLCCFLCFALGAVYIYFRYGDYHTLKEDSMFLSAPDLQAPPLFEKTSGLLLKQLRSMELNGETWSQVGLPHNQTGWLKSDKLIPINPLSHP